MHRLVAVLADRHAEALARIEHAISRETPAYERFSQPEARQAWAAGIDGTLRLFEALVADCREMTSAEAEGLRSIGRRRADEDFPLDAVVNSVRVAVHVAHEFVAEKADDERWELGELGWALTRFGNRVTSLIVSGYTERRQELATTAERGRVQLVDDLLVGGVPDDLVIERGKALGVELSGPVGLFLVPATGTHALETDVRTLLPDALGANLATGGTPHVVVVLPVAGEREWEEACRVVAGCSEGHVATVLALEPASGPSELRERYEEGVEVLPYVPGLERGRALVHGGDVRVLHVAATATVVARRGVVRVVTAGLAALPARTAELIDTLVALVRHDFGIKEAAQELRKTPRTVRRRMSTIEAATGLPFSGWRGPAVYALFVHVHELSLRGRS